MRMSEVVMIGGMLLFLLALTVASIIYAIVGVRSSKRRIAELERQVGELTRFARAVRQRMQAQPVSPAQPAAQQPHPKAAEPVQPQVRKTAPPPVVEPLQPPVSEPEAQPTPGPITPGPAYEPEPDQLKNAWLAVTSLITGGNLAVKTGVVVLFFGVSFLLKYAVEHQMLSVELRLSGAALLGIALIATGWRLRESRRAYALVIQGGGVGILYLTTFAALRLYSLIPPTLAFFILVALAALSALLAVLQDSPAMAVLGVSGGFLAPVLTSTGAGNYIVLFSYYAVLNASIIAIAWFRAWRVLNLAGFLFTFVIGTAWGVNSYRPEFFATTEPFLILFFVMYVLVAVLFAIRQPVELKGYLDGTLVFGTPLVSFGLQAVMVTRYEYGMAYSALALGVFYIGIAWALFARGGPYMRVLTEAFLAFGVVFASLAIPLALDGRWTASAWAVEGAAILWAGVRQQRRLARAFGMLLQLGAGIAFAGDFHHVRSELPLLNGYYMGCLLISVAGVFSAYTLYKKRGQVDKWEYVAAMPLLAWGLMWWFSGGINEADRHVYVDYFDAVCIAFVAVSCAALDVLSRRLDWHWLKYPALGIVPAMFLMLACQANSQEHPLAYAGYAAWPFAYAVCYRILYNNDDIQKTALNFLHAAPVWLTFMLFAWEISWQVDHYVKGSPTWPLIATGVVPAIIGITIPLMARRISWPFGGYARAYLLYGLGPVVAFAWAWSLFANLTSRGDPWPLSYIPFVNPLDVAVGFVFAALMDWHSRSRAHIAEAAPSVASLPALMYAAGIFVWLNAVLVRTVHYWGGVSFNRYAMFSSMLFQASLSIFWSVLALGTMVVATRRKLRAVWITGAVLLGTVVVKLFLVDLSRTGTVERIVSFVVVGILLLVVGYFSPVPPRKGGEVE